LGRCRSYTEKLRHFAFLYSPKCLEKRNSPKFGVSMSPAWPRPYTKRDGGEPLLVLPHAPDCCV
jgi:hypothetical protein